MDFIVSYMLLDPNGNVIMCVCVCIEFNPAIMHYFDVYLHGGIDNSNKNNTQASVFRFQSQFFS